MGKICTHLVYTNCYVEPVEDAAPGRAEVRTVNVRQFRAECLPIIREIEQGGGDVIITRHGEPVARVTGHVGSLPAPFFGCDADTLEVFVDDLSTVSAFAEEEWDMVSNLDRVLDPS